jgi:uncharacterized membrane protein YphA (DoxX/SURF4 family)
MSEHGRGGDTPNLSLFLGRVSLGLYFFLAGVAKVQGGVGKFVAGPYSESLPPWVPDLIAQPYGHALPFLELAAGGALVLGLMGRTAALGCAMMLFSFMLANGIDGGPGPFSHNVVFFSLALILTSMGPGSWSLDHKLLRRG